MEGGGGPGFPGRKVIEGELFDLNGQRDGIKREAMVDQLVPGKPDHIQRDRGKNLE